MMALMMMMMMEAGNWGPRAQGTGQLKAI